MDRQAIESSGATDRLASDSRTGFLSLHKLAVQIWATDKLIPYARNARTHSDEQVTQIAASIVQFGFTNPILVDGSAGIVAGHGRLLAAQQLGLPEVPVIVLDHLTEIQKRAYILADNKLALNAGWDDDILRSELVALEADGFDLDLVGFSDDELTDLLADPESESGNRDDDMVPVTPVTATTVTGDLWLLGNHRLLCGDATKVADVEQLLGGSLADMVFLDPPYGVRYDAEARPNGPTSKERKARPLGKITNDDKSPEDFRSFLDAVYTNCNAALRPGRAIYICHADTEGHHFRNAFIAQPWKLQSCLIWKKTVLVFGRADYHWMHEPVLYGWKEGAPHVWEGDRKQTTIIEVATDHCLKAESDTGGKYVHPTQKPVALIAQALVNSSKAGEVVLDLFGGSGSTLIACEKARRHARLLELEPRFCDVIIRRWQDYSGQKATHEETCHRFEDVARLRGGVTAEAVDESLCQSQ